MPEPKLSKALRPPASRKEDGRASAGYFEGEGRAFDMKDPFEGSGGFQQQKGVGYEDWGTTGTVRGLLMALGGDRKITRPYLQNPWVYACVRAISDSVSDLKVKLVRDGEGENSVEVKDHPVLDLLEAPNPLHSQRDLLTHIANYHCLFGETFLILLKDRMAVDDNGNMVRSMLPIERGEMPDEIWPVRGDLVTEVCDELTQLPAYWRVKGKRGAVVDYPAHAVVQIAAINPYSMLRGVGPMTAALRDAAKAYTSDRYDEALIQNGGTPSGTLSIDGPVTDPQLSAIKRAWKEAHEGPESHGKTVVLPMGTKYQPHSFSPKDMEFQEMREWIRQTIMAVFKVTKPILGITEDVNKANAREAYRVFWETSIMPLVRFLEDQLNYKFLRRRSGVDKGLRLVLSMSGVEALRDDIDARIDRTLKLYEKGHRSFKESARLAGWDIESSEGDGERWIPLNLVPAEVAIEGPPTPGPSSPPGGSAGSGEDEDAEDEVPDGDVEESVASLAPSELQTRAQREKDRESYWRAFDESLRPHEAKLMRKVERAHRDFLLAVRKKLREIAEGERGYGSVLSRVVVTEAELERLLELNDEKWKLIFASAIEKPLEEAIIAAARSIHAEVAGAGFLITLEDSEVLSYMRIKKIQMVEGPLSNLVQNVQRKLTATLASSSGNVATISDAIREVLEELEDEVETMVEQAGRRAMMIARTEITSATNFARVRQMKADGIVRHSWLSSRDDAVRETHVSLDGEIRLLEEDFKPGLARPGDTRAPASEVVNCRCTTIPELDDDEDE